MKTPLIFLVFNRPDTTQRVFDVIRQAKPPQLLVVADGPRSHKPGEVEKCEAVRAIIDQVDWSCEVIRHYSDVNLGCRNCVSQGLTWAFNTVEEAIILEDDCLPHPAFFPFCEAMLEQYRQDKRVMSINGTNVMGKWKADSQSYHFSYHGGIWGWASWRRAWQYYDVSMQLWADPEIKSRVRDTLASEFQYKARAASFEAVYQGKVDTWDYQWVFARLVQSGLSVVPAVNLISNIGFRPDATHTTVTDSVLAELETFDLRFPLKYNEFTAVDRDYDHELVKKIAPTPKLSARFKNKLKLLVPGLKR